MTSENTIKITFLNKNFKENPKPKYELNWAIQN